ncbi:hypothetical protein MRB56_09280 [Halomonas cupida]|uniref:hypothetical protein n=1 Tax=Halomonas cupida TaxID=44933 RepID=UPI0039B53538
MDKPTVTVTPDDGDGTNKVEVRYNDLQLPYMARGDRESALETGLAVYHAIERIAELEAERDNAYLLMEKHEDEARVSPGFWGGFASREGTRADKADRERDALSAHVESLQLALGRISRVLESGDWPVNDDMNHMHEALAETPTETSLAQRDARMKAEALEEVIRRIDLHQRLFREQMVCGDPSKGLDKAAYVAGVMLDEYRQQAEGES